MLFRSTLVGLRDDYLSDGAVLGFIRTGHHDRWLGELAAAYRQLNSSVGAFGTDALRADTAALASSSAGDQEFNRIQAQLTALADGRDALAQQMKVTLDEAEFGRHHANPVLVRQQLTAAHLLLGQMHRLAESHA